MKKSRWAQARVFVLALVALVALAGGFVAFEWHVWHQDSGDDAPDKARAELENTGDSPSGAPRSVAPAEELVAAAVDVNDLARISGRVLGTDGTPFVDATVCAWFEHTGPAGTDVLPPVCALSDASGAYVLDDVRAGIGLKVGATAPGCLPATYTAKVGESRLVLMPHEQRGGIDLTLEHGGVALRGRVKDALGGLVAGATIAISFEDDRAEVPAVSDAKGEFVAWVAPGLANVRANAPGYAEAFGSGYAPEHRFELSLLPGAGIIGRAVTRPGGAAVAGAHIEAIAVDQRSRKSVTSQADGTFRVDGLAPGRYRLEGVAPGLSGYAQAAVTVGLAETSHEVVVELERSPPVTALVRDSSSKAPCESGKVTLHDKRIGEYALASIEPHGAVRFVAVLPGKYEVDVECDGHASKEKYDDVKVESRAIEGLVWEVDRGSEARGVVVDPSGKPVPNANVSAEPREKENGSSRTYAFSDAKGRFVLRGLADGNYDVSADAPAAGAGATTAVTINGHSVSELRIELGRAAKITGTVTDADGKPVSSATVMVAGPAYMRVETKDDGSFAAPGLKPGNYKVSVSMDGQRLRLVGPTGEDLGDSANVTIATTEEVSRALVTERRAGVLEGRVVDSRGEALPDFFVEAQRSFGRTKSRGYGPSATRVISDANGHFRIEGLTAGDFTVRAYRQSGAQGIVEKIAVGTTNVTIPVTAGAIVGTVTSSTGVAPARFEIQVSGGKRVSRSESVFHANGAFLLPELPAGTYDVSVEAPEGTGSATGVVVTDKGTTNVSITLTPKTEDVAP